MMAQNVILSVREQQSGYPFSPYHCHLLYQRVRSTQTGTYMLRRRRRPPWVEIDGNHF